MNIIAFAASNHKKSINKKLASYAASLIPDACVEVLDLNDFELPLFSQDREAELGHPALIQAFLDKLNAADGLVISFAEHNGSYSAAYKNLFDWASRVQKKVYENKPVLLLSTSPGPGGASSVLAAAVGSMPYFGALVKGSLSIPNFYANFDEEKGALIQPELDATLHQLALDLVK